MSILAHILGYTAVAFFLLAATNGLKRYTKNKVVRAIAKQHKLFGLAATLTAVVHLIVNLINGNTNPLGLIALILLITTGTLGGAFFKTKKKQLYPLHRIAGPLAMVAILIHIIFQLI